LLLWTFRYHVCHLLTLVSLFQINFLSKILKTRYSFHTTMWTTLSVIISPLLINLWYVYFLHYDLIVFCIDPFWYDFIYCLYPTRRIQSFRLIHASRLSLHRPRELTRSFGYKREQSWRISKKSILWFLLTLIPSHWKTHKSFYICYRLYTFEFLISLAYFLWSLDHKSRLAVEVIFDHLCWEIGIVSGLFFIILLHQD